MVHPNECDQFGAFGCEFCCVEEFFIVPCEEDVNASIHENLRRNSELPSMVFSVTYCLPVPSDSIKPHNTIRRTIIQPTKIIFNVQQ